MSENRRTIKGAKGQYDLLAELSRDELSESHLAINTKASDDARWVVVRETRPKVAADPAGVRKFLDELRITSRFSHPNLIRALETGRTKTSYFSITDFVLGDGLGRLVQGALRTKQALSPALAVGLIAQVCDGLEAAHETRDGKGKPLQPIHHNIHPNAILITYSGQVKLTDFDVHRTAFRIEQGVPSGDVAYLSPELCEKTEPDKRSDLFSLGIVLWELLARKPLFKGQSHLDTTRAILAAKVPPIAEPDRVPGELEAIVSRALQRNPRSRFESAAKMAEALRGWLGQAGQEAGEFEIGTFCRKILGNRNRQKRALLEKALGAGLAEDQIPRLSPDKRTVAVWTSVGAKNAKKARPSPPKPAKKTKESKTKTPQAVEKMAEPTLPPPRTMLVPEEDLPDEVKAKPIESQQPAKREPITVPSLPPKPPTDPDQPSIQPDKPADEAQDSDVKAPKPATPGEEPGAVPDEEEEEDILEELGPLPLAEGEAAPVAEPKVSEESIAPKQAKPSEESNTNEEAIASEEAKWLAGTDAPEKPTPSIRISMPGKSSSAKKSRLPLWLGLGGLALVIAVVLAVVWPTDDSQPEPSKPIDAPVQPKPDEPIQPKPDEPVQPKPDEPIQPKPDEPVQPKPDEPIQPDPLKESPATLEIQSTPAGCPVWLDRRKLDGVTPLPEVQVSPDKEHMLVVVCPGYKKEKRTISASVGEHLKLAFSPQKAPKATTGILQLNSMPWTEVYLGKKKLGITPILNARLPPGTHTLRMVNPKAGIDKRISVTIQAGKKTSLLKKF